MCHSLFHITCSIVWQQKEEKKCKWEKLYWKFSSIEFLCIWAQTVGGMQTDKGRSSHILGFDLVLLIEKAVNIMLVSDVTKNMAEICSCSFLSILFKCLLPQFSLNIIWSMNLYISFILWCCNSMFFII